MAQLCLPRLLICYNHDFPSMSSASTRAPSILSSPRSVRSLYQRAGVGHVAMRMNTIHTPTALSRWSCQKHTALPSVDSIKSIHVYDFDNTLFKSPLPNKQLWNGSTCGTLQAQDSLYKGGWWHNPKILAATGEGVEIEEARAWQGYWNETIVDLCRISMEDTGTLNVLLTGRMEGPFGELIGRMIESRGLKFDMVCLKPETGPNGDKFKSTMFFKQALLKDIIFTYTTAEEIRVYEDRPKHTKGFRDFFQAMNTSLMSGMPFEGQSATREAITAEVIQVTEADSQMDPVKEVAEVQRMVNVHNQAILDGTAPPGSVSFAVKRSVFYTGYLISAADTERLRSLIKLPFNCPEHEIKYLANNILICPRPADRQILDRVGGMGAKVKWRVTGVSCFEQRVWAARVQPVNPGTRIYTENKTPCVVLATRKASKPIDARFITNWQPVPEHQAFEFETTVGEKVLLRVEKEYDHEDQYEASFPTARNARKHPRDDDFPPLGSERPAEKLHSRPQQQRGSHGGGYGGTYRGNAGGIGFAAHRGGANVNRGGGRGGVHAARGRGRGMPRGRGGRGAYKSLDDNVGQGYNGGSMQY